MGMIDYYRLPLKCWYWYRNFHEISSDGTQIPLYQGM